MVAAGSPDRPTFAHPALPGVAGAAPPAEVAVIAWHGIGQQIELETIELVVRGLAYRQPGASPDQPPRVDTRMAEFGSEKLWRAELDVAGTRVHVYEVYWAPLTAGKIKLSETVSFLVRAGLSGLWYCTVEPFRRHLFGRWETYPVSTLTAVELALLLLTIAALVVLNFAVVAATSVAALTGGSGAWPNAPLVGDLTVDFALYEAWMGAAIAFLAGAYLAQRGNRRRSRPSTPWRAVQVLLWTLIVAAMLATIAAGGLVGYHLLRDRTSDRVMWWTWPQWVLGTMYGYGGARWGPRAAIAGVWIAAVAVSAVVRSFIVQYVGDVAIYIATHRLDRYLDTRKAIKDMSLAILRAIYQHGGYKRHILVGHSLGSVVAYDTLNGLLNEDVGRADRTQLLMTMGSPLDKTAFVFRAQSEFSDVREAMAAATQPIIVDYRVRPEWINIHSPNDPISGALDYYDPPARRRPPEARPVRNVTDEQSWIPLVAHIQYWTNAAFVSRLIDAIAGEHVSGRR